MRSYLRIAIAISVAVIVAGIRFATYSLGASATQTSTYFTAQKQIVATSPNGLELSLTLNSTTIPVNGTVYGSAAVYNTYDSQNNVSVSNDWSLQILRTNQGCGTANPASVYPVSDEVFQGYYTMSNISSAKPLSYNPPGLGIAGCREYGPYYLFQPASSEAMINNVVGINVSNNLPITRTSTINVSDIIMRTGYYSSTLTQTVGPNATVQPAFLHYSPGVYTIAAGDEWGALVLLHFLVV